MSLCLCVYTVNIGESTLVDRQTDRQLIHDKRTYTSNWKEHRATVSVNPATTSPEFFLVAVLLSIVVSTSVLDPHKINGSVTHTRPSGPSERHQRDGRCRRWHRYSGCRLDRCRRRGCRSLSIPSTRVVRGSYRRFDDRRPDLGVVVARSFTSDGQFGIVVRRLRLREGRTAGDRPLDGRRSPGRTRRDVRLPRRRSSTSDEMESRLGDRSGR